MGFQECLGEMVRMGKRESLETREAGERRVSQEIMDCQDSQD